MIAATLGSVAAGLIVAAVAYAVVSLVVLDRSGGDR